MAHAFMLRGDMTLMASQGRQQHAFSCLVASEMFPLHQPAYKGKGTRSTALVLSSTVILPGTTPHYPDCRPTRIIALQRQQSLPISGTGKDASIWSRLRAARNCSMPLIHPEMWSRGSSCRPIMQQAAPSSHPDQCQSFALV